MLQINPSVKLFIVIASLLLLTACNIQQLTNNDESATNNFELPPIDNFYYQELPVKSSINIYEAIARAVKTNSTFYYQQLNNVSKLNNFRVTDYDQLSIILYDKTSNQLLETHSLNCDAKSEQIKIMAAEKQRKMNQLLVADIKKLYWKVNAQQRIRGRITSLQKEIYEALDYSKVIYSSNNKPPLEALEYQRELWGLLHKLTHSQELFAQNKSKLAVMMGLNPDANYSLNGTRKYTSPIASKHLVNLKKLEAIALRMRPEVRSVYCSPDLSKENRTINLKTLLTQTPSTSSNNKRDLAKAKLIATAKQAIEEVNVAYIDFQHMKKEVHMVNQVTKLDLDIVKSFSKRSVKQLSEHFAVDTQEN